VQLPAKTWKLLMERVPSHARHPFLYIHINNEHRLIFAEPGVWQLRPLSCMATRPGVDIGKLRDTPVD
jgi:hypothetical protein